MDKESQPYLMLCLNLPYSPFSVEELSADRFGKGGCWKVEATKGRSSLWLYFSGNLESGP